MVNFKQERGEKVKPYDPSSCLSQKAIDAIHKVADNKKRFEKSNSLISKGCRKMGIGYWDLIGAAYPTYCRYLLVVLWFRRQLASIDNCISRLNDWIINL